MRKLYLMLTALLVSLVSSQAGTTTIDLSDVGTAYQNASAMMSGTKWPSDCWLKYNNAAGITFSTSPAGVKFTASATAYTCYLVSYAKKGKVKYTMQVYNSRYVEGESAATSAWVALYKMERNGETADFTVGDEIKAKQSPIPGAKYGEWTTFEYEVPEDCYVGLYTQGTVINKIENEFEDAAVTYTVTGTITDEDGNAVEGATVDINGATATTGANGGYTLEEVPEGTNTMTVTAPGYVNYSRQIEVAEGTVADATLTFVKSTITLRAWFEGNRNAIKEELTFTLWDSTKATKVLENIIGHESGNYIEYDMTVKGELAADGYVLTCENKYFEPYEAVVGITTGSEIGFNKGQTRTCPAYLTEKKLKLTAKVVDSEGEPIDNAVVVLSVADKPYGVDYSDDSETYVTKEGIPALTARDSEWEVTCVVPGMKPVEAQKVVFDGEDQTVNFEVADWEATTVTGKVTRKDSEAAIEGAEVALYDGDTAIEGAVATTDAEGVYTVKFDGEIPEALTVKVTAEYFEAATAEVAEVEREGEATVNVALEPTMLTFYATVADEAGKAIEGAEVTIDEEALEQNEDGDYVAEIWAGEFADEEKSYTVTATATGYFAESYELTGEAYADGRPGADHAFVLKEKVFTYTATVTDADGEALKAAKVTIVDAEGAEVDVESTADGEFTYSVTYLEMPEGKLSVKVECENYEPQTSEFIFIEDGEETYEISEEFKLDVIVYTYSLTVVDKATGEAIENAKVTIVNGEEKSEAKHAGAGVYEFEADAISSADVTYKVEVEAEGYEAGSAEFSFAEGDATGKVELEKQSGINGVEADAVDARYFNLQGVEIKSPAAGQTYIKVVGNKAVKVLVK